MDPHCSFGGLSPQMRDLRIGLKLPIPHQFTHGTVRSSGPKVPFGRENGRNQDLPPLFCRRPDPGDLQSKPIGTKMAYPEPCTGLRRRMSTAIYGRDRPLLTFTNPRVLSTWLMSLFAGKMVERRTPPLLTPPLPCVSIGWEGRLSATTCFHNSTIRPTSPAL